MMALPVKSCPDRINKKNCVQTVAGFQTVRHPDFVKDPPTETKLQSERVRLEAVEIPGHLYFCLKICHTTVMK